MTQHEPNQPGHIDQRTGRLCITLEEAYYNREDVDTPLYIHLPGNPFDEWVTVDGIDKASHGFDVWVLGAYFPFETSINCPVYLSKRESVDWIINKNRKVK